MKVLGREIKFEKLMPILIRYPEASLIAIFNKIRQKLFIESHFNGYSLMPSVVVIEITYSCNLRCKTCWFYGKSGTLKNKIPKESLNFEQLKKLINEIAIFKPYIYITGGEPLINPVTIPFIKYAKKMGLIVGIVTNATLLTRESAEKLINSGLDFITVSIDGYKELHDKIRGVKCFDKAIEGIRNLIEARKNKKLPIVTLNCTISDYNYRYLEKVVEIAENLKVDIIALQHPCFLVKKTIKSHHKVFENLFGKSDNLVDGYENNSASKINPEELYSIIQKVKNKTKTSLRLFQDFSLEQMKTYYEQEKAINKKCISPWFSATIKPNGDITPCLGYVIGNINKGSFMNAWNNKRFKNFRNILNKRKFFPGCIRCCGFFFNWE